MGLISLDFTLLLYHIYYKFGIFDAIISSFDFISVSLEVKTYLASNARVDTHRAFFKFQLRCVLKKLVGQHPKPFNDFFKIGYAPAELNINLSSESESGIFGFTAFRHIRFFLISVDRHLAKVSAHILYPKLRHIRLYQAEFSFIYEKFDLYRSLAIPVV